MLVHVELGSLGGDQQVAHEQEDHPGYDHQGHQDDECFDDFAEDMEDAVAPVKVAHGLVLDLVSGLGLLDHGADGHR